MYLKYLCVLIFYLSTELIQHKVFARNKVKCGILPIPNIAVNYVIGGFKPKYLQYPWMVAVFLRSGKKWWPYCGASLINSKFVLTAAHCFYGPDEKRITNIKKFKVTLGMSKLSKKESYRQDQCMKTMVVHEKYDYHADKNDIAIFQLCEPIMFKTTNIRPICLPGKDDKANLYQGEAMVAGWGITTATAKKTASELLTVPLLEGSYRTCIKQLIIDNKDSYLANTTICTYTEGTGKDTCKGDSGGPLMFFNKKNGQVYMRGILSFGSTTCGGYGVFTKVSHYLDWIYENMPNTENKNKKIKQLSKRPIKKDFNIPNMDTMSYGMDLIKKIATYVKSKI